MWTNTQYRLCEVQSVAELMLLARTSALTYIVLLLLKDAHHILVGNLSLFYVMPVIRILSQHRSSQLYKK